MDIPNVELDSVVDLVVPVSDTEDGRVESAADALEYISVSSFARLCVEIHTASDHLVSECQIVESAWTEMHRALETSMCEPELPLLDPVCPVSYTHLTLPTNREV